MAKMEGKGITSRSSLVLQLSNMIPIIHGIEKRQDMEKQSHALNFNDRIPKRNANKFMIDDLLF